MKQNIGIWIDTKQAYVIKLSNDAHTFKKIASNIDTRERVPGESKKYGRFGGQYLTFEKNRSNRKNEQTNQYLKNLVSEISPTDTIVLFGPANMKHLLEKEIKNLKNMSINLAGVFNSTAMTENQMIAWVKDFYKK